MVCGFKMAVTSGTIHELCLGCGTEALKDNRRVLSSSSTSLVASSVKYVLIQRLERTYSEKGTCLSSNDYSLIKLMTLHYTRGDTRDVFITS